MKGRVRPRPGGARAESLADGPSRVAPRARTNKRPSKARPAETPNLAVVEPVTPFRGEGVASRALPFGVVTVLAAASIALPPGPRSPGEALLAVGLLGLVGGAFLLPWHRLPPILGVLVPLVYTAGALLLSLSAGTTVSGIGIIMLVPVVWTALYQRPWESAVVVVATGLAEVVTSLVPTVLPAAVSTRKVVFWILMTALISMATHSLRAHVRRNAATREARFRQTRALVFAAEELTGTLEPDEVISKAVRLAAELVSPAGTPGRRAQYMRLRDGTVDLAAEYDETGGGVTTSFSMSQHPNLERVVRAHTAFSLRLEASSTDPAVERLGLGHSVYVPVMIDGELDGVLSVPVRDTTVPVELFEQCKALGHIVELALSNARAHAQLRQSAVTDVLTGLRNRRGFEEFVASRPGRSGFAILALDVDKLKHVNDTRGHAAGDELLLKVGSVVSGVLRRGDVLARLGGDEFAAYLFEADEADARLVAERVLSALRAADRDRTLSVSVGIAVGSPDDEASEVLAAADAAMYRAKRAGGCRYELLTG